MIAMRQLLSIVISSVVLAAPVMAQVDPKTHKLCIEAKDYAGCVRAMNGDSLAPARQVNSQGADIAEGNQCPASFAYIGGGNCQQVYCQYPSSDLGHDQIVAGKPGWGCKYNWLRGPGELRLGAVGRATQNLKCPPGEPPIGYNSTCQIGMEGKETIEEPQRTGSPKRPGEY
jgi:hypothetical protein